MIQGSLVAIVTPMHPDGRVDENAFRRLIDWHVTQGTDAIVAVGTTGESATLDEEEPNREDWTVRGTLEFDVTDDRVATLKAEVSEFDVYGRHIEIVNEQPAAGGPGQVGVRNDPEMNQQQLGLEGVFPALVPEAKMQTFPDRE